MSNIEIIARKAKKYAVSQNSIDFLAAIIFTFATVVISISVALLLMKSPWYGLIGFVPLFFFRPAKLISRAQELERRCGLKGEIVNSLQLSKIPEDSKERYSQELIQAFITEAAEIIERIDVRRFVSYAPLVKAARFALIAIAFALTHPTFFPARFWYALNHQILYSVSPGNAECAKDTKVDVVLHLWGVYIPKTVNLNLSTVEKIAQQRLRVQDGIAQQNIMVSEGMTYRFGFLEHKTEAYELLPIEQLYIENLIFRLRYPAYTGLAEEVQSGRQLVVPVRTMVYVQGRASEALQTVSLEFGDTTLLECDGRDFQGRFIIRESGTAILRLKARDELEELIRIYSIPDLAPLVDIFYPGTNVNLPYDMGLDVGIRCSDDYGLSRGDFHYTFEKESTEVVAVKRGSLEDTIYFTWDLSELGMLPGDEVSYHVQITDNSGQVAKSSVYYVYFPTMEQMYEEVSGKETMLQNDIGDMKTQHGEHMEEISRIQEKLMRERELSWADQEQLRQAIQKEEGILEKISQWHSELKETIEKLNEGIILDRESIDRLNEITRIMEEIAPEELRRALQNLKLAMERRPVDMSKTLEQVQKYQEEFAAALERSLEILKRFEQEEKLRQLAEQAKELSEMQEAIEELAETGEEVTAEKQGEVDEGIEELVQKLNDLALSEGLEEDIKEALKQMAVQMKDMKNAPGKSKKAGLENLAMSLQQLYEKMTQGRFVNLRKNLLESLKQVIETSKAQEELSRGKMDPDLQQEILQTAEVIAESLFQQQKQSFFVKPQISKGLARATLQMKEALRHHKNEKLAKARSIEAMRELNLVARDILFSLQMMEQGGSSTGMNSFMEQLGDITDGQMMLSQSLMNILPLPVQGLTQAQQNQLQRLAARQRELREALESLRGEAAAGKYRDVLDDMVNEMQEMEEALFQYKVDRELIERQKKLISKLLDSQRSIRDEDYAKRRKSKPGQEIVERLRPAPLTQELGKDELREMLQQELRKPYPKEYEIYIREYFKTLLEEQ